MNSDQTPCIIYADLESLIKKINKCKIIEKNLQQQKYVNILLVVIQCQLYGHLII